MAQVKKKNLVLLIAVATSILSVADSDEEAKPVHCVYSCNHRLEGHFIDCQRCDYFVQCANSLMFRMHCPPGLYFDPVMLVCTGKMSEYCDADGNYIGPGSGSIAPSDNPHVTPPASYNPSLDPPPQPRPQHVPAPSPYDPLASLDSLFQQPPQPKPDPAPAPAPYDPFASLNSLFQQPPPRNSPPSRNPQDPYASLDSMFGKVDGNNIRPEHLGTSLDDYFNGNIDLNNLGTVVDYNAPAGGSVPYGVSQPVHYDQVPKPAPSTPKHYPECTDTCVDKSNGRYANCKYCNDFVVCRDGALEVVKCYDGYYYNYRAGQCEVDTEYVCIPRPHEPASNEPTTAVDTPPAATDTSGGDSQATTRVAKACTSTCMDSNGKYLPTGNYPSCEFCDAYVACEDAAKMTIMQCPRGTHYDAYVGVCDHGPCSSSSYGSRGVTNTQQNPPPYKPAEPTVPRKPATPEHRPEQKPRIFKGCTAACRDSYGNPIPSGQYPDCQYCNAFIVCNDGRITVNSCPEGTYYDPDSGVCGHEPQGGRCIASTPTEPESPHATDDSANAAAESGGAQSSGYKPGHSVAKVGETVHPTCIASCFADGTKAADGLYANCEYCDQFIRCEGYKESRGLCGRYMLYNAKYGTCVEDTNYVCSSPPPEEKQYVHLPEETIHPVCIDSCYGYSDIEYGLYALCAKCDHFIRCEAHKEERGLCREGRYYNAETGSCDLDTEGTCEQSKRPGIPVHRPEETVYPLCIDSCQSYDTPIAPGIYAKCSNCDQYIRCGGGDYETTGICDRGRFYNAEEGTCDLDVDDTCAPSNRQGHNIAKEGETVNPYCIDTCFDDGGYVVAKGLYAKCAACDQYIRCEGHTEQQGLCINGYIYNAVNGACEQDVDDTCESTKKPGVPVSKAGEKVHPNCIESCVTPSSPYERVPDGLYAYCPQCDQYIRCGSILQIIDVCDRGKFYNAQEGTCDEDTDNTCIPTGDDPPPTTETARPYPPPRQPPQYHDSQGQPLPPFSFPHDYPSPEFYMRRK